MDTYPGVFVGTDGSPEAATAVEIGAVLAARLDVPLTLVTAWDGFTNVPEPQSYEWAMSVTDSAQQSLATLGVTDVIVDMPTGTAAEVLLDVGERNPDALLVIGGHSLASPKRRALGSVANRLSHHSAADVLFALGGSPEHWRSVALTTDGSATSRQAVRRGLSIAQAVGASPHLVTVAKDENEGERLMAASIGEFDLDQPDVVLKRDILIGLLPAKALIDAGSNYDLMVIGNRSMSGPARLLGSVANKVTHGVETNLLLVNTSRS